MKDIQDKLWKLSKLTETSTKKFVEITETPQYQNGEATDGKWWIKTAAYLEVIVN